MSNVQGWLTNRRATALLAHNTADTLDGGRIRTWCGVVWNEDQTHRAPDTMPRCPRCVSATLRRQPASDAQ